MKKKTLFILQVIVAVSIIVLYGLLFLYSHVYPASIFTFSFGGILALLPIVLFFLSLSNIVVYFYTDNGLRNKKDLIMSSILFVFSVVIMIAFTPSGTMDTIGDYDMSPSTIDTSN